MKYYYLDEVADIADKVANEKIVAEEERRRQAEYQRQMRMGIVVVQHFEIIKEMIDKNLMEHALQGDRKGLFKYMFDGISEEDGRDLTKMILPMIRKLSETYNTPNNELRLVLNEYIEYHDQYSTDNPVALKVYGIQGSYTIRIRG